MPRWDCARTVLCPGANCIDTMRSETGMTHSLSQSTQSWALSLATRDERQDYNVSPTTHVTTSFCNAARLWCPSINLSHCGSRCNVSISQCTLDTNHAPEVPAGSTCPCSFIGVIAPNTLQSLDDGVTARSEPVTVSLSVCACNHVISIIHRALQQSIERDKERTVSIMNLIESDK